MIEMELVDTINLQKYVFLFIKIQCDNNSKYKN